jgi:3',5'-nucleoside bisphosphate phosphatase
VRVDFHVHSTASDGTLAPRELAEAAADFDAIALTDHDNCDGVGEFCGEEVPRNQARRFAGIELSIEPGKGFDKFHLLGLGIDAEDAGLKAFLAKVLEGRRARNEKIRENFARIGIEIGAEDIAGYAHGEVLARPHFANWLVRHGYAGTAKEAFEKYLTARSPRETRCYEERWHPTQEEAFGVVHAAGGVAVMAHPKFWKGAWAETGVEYEAAERELARLKEAGLDGVEAVYQANTVEETIGFTRVAVRLGFLTSAGSDFHGANKPSIHLGMDVSEAFIGPLLERLEK